MKKPYTDKISGATKTRTFETSTESHELVWHRDKADRIVTVLEGQGWFFQMDNNVPYELKEGDVINIPKMKYHRLYKAGSNNLVIKIEEPNMKTFKEHIEKSELYEAPFKVDTIQYGASPSRFEKGVWKFNYRVPTNPSPALGVVDDGEFQFKGTYGKALKALHNLFKKMNKPKIKQAVVKLDKKSKSVK